MAKKNNKKQYKGRRFKKNEPDRRSAPKEANPNEDLKREAKPGKPLARLVSEENDVALYSKNPQLMQDVASFPFAYMLGTQTDLDPSNTILRASQFIVPGVMALYYLPTLGYSNDLSSPINVAARNMFTTLRKKVSGSRTYDAPDLMMYIGAADGLYSFHSLMKRVYGTVRNYTPYNKYYADTLVAMMGVDPADVRQNLAQYRGFINMMAAQLSNIATPANLGLFTRHQWMTEGLYLDSGTKKAQTYLYVPLALPRFDYMSDPNGTSLVYETWYDPQAVQTDAATGGISFVNPSKLKKLADCQAYWDKLYQGIMLDDDFNTISGDVANAFGDGSLTRIMPISDDYFVEPEFIEEVLSQIENATVLPMTFQGGAMTEWPKVTQQNDINNGAIIYTPTFRAPNAGISNVGVF
nr:putative capsid [Marmot picobirnavirus]